MKVSKVIQKNCMKNEIPTFGKLMVARHVIYPATETYTPRQTDTIFLYEDINNLMYLLNLQEGSNI